MLEIGRRLPRLKQEPLQEGTDEARGRIRYESLGGGAQCRIEAAALPWFGRAKRVVRSFTTVR
jgi:hypothetical protein